MELDIDKSFGELYTNEHDFKTQLQEISKATASTNEFHAWAKKLRFITPHPDTWGADEAVPREEKILYTNVTTSLGGGTDDRFPESEITDSSSRPCDCNLWSRTPFDKDARSLWISGRNDAPSCTHFVAISYCWPQPSEGISYPTAEYSLSYADGEKCNDAPNEVIERALKFATCVGLSAVWIDQECINQSDREDKEAGINSMDIVYENAQTSLGLLSLQITDQKFLHFLDEEQIQGMQFNSESVHDLRRFIEWIDTERWLTRAWCMQESWSAGSKMLIMMKCDNSLKKPKKFGNVDGEVLINFETLSKILNGIVSALEKAQKQFLDFKLDQVWLDRFKRKAVKTSPKEASQDMVIGSRTRLRCSAAEGLNFLGPRENSRIVDRIAILGNLCNFSVRLNTDKLEQLGCGFSICAYALAVLNGDLSLMHCRPLQLSPLPALSEDSAPSGTALLELEKMALVDREQRLGYSWGPPVLGSLIAPEWVPEETNPKRLARNELTHEGLNTYGWLYLCDVHIDVSPVRQYFLDAYEELMEKKIPLHDIRFWKFHIAFIWALVRHLIHMKYFALAQIIWNHENDLAFTEDTTESPTEEVPRDLGKLVDPETEHFTWPSISEPMNQHDFINKLVPKARLADRADSNRTWLVAAAMTGKILCGRQINAGIAMPPASTMMSISTAGGKLEVKPGWSPEPERQPPEIFKTDIMVPGTTNPKSMYTCIIESEAASMKCVFEPALQHPPSVAKSLHNWRPQYWIAKRVFKGSAGELWKVEGGALTRGYAQATSLWSPCLLT
ncbi:hypothetical protein AC578_1253 [Pseudocercospora eumusae]|uniref:Heterokaryon incompatibility domain-containing protein n=1 Tax=Pseudocercospora eumusae TaxID=321146 RepID=A0A139H8A8_9PEZI|nr:hypothetical protein AC578_1253 [Pseudocercospora eumusae]